MKDYIKKQYTGDENGWGEPIKEASTHRITKEQADELNSHFRNTGTKYEPADGKAPVKDENADNGNTAPPKKKRPSRTKVKA